MASALHAERDFAGVTQHQRTHVQTVRSHRSKTDGVTLRYDDGTAHTQRVSRAARRRADDESVCLIGCQVFVVDVRVDGNHRRDVMLQNGNLVEGKRIVLQFHLVA